MFTELCPSTYPSMTPSSDGWSYYYFIEDGAEDGADINPVPVDEPFIAPPPVDEEDEDC